jgi:hypothetical protein
MPGRIDDLNRPHFAANTIGRIHRLQVDGAADSRNSLTDLFYLLRDRDGKNVSKIEVIRGLACFFENPASRDEGAESGWSAEGWKDEEQGQEAQV